MEIEEAIKTNTTLAEELDIPQRAKERKAVKLGIEALKWILWRRQYYKQPPILLLPGETK